jgi:DNA repair exonuclease SbcCD nuclease subunit
MFRFVHSADWQLGARFPRFGSRATRLREARVRTLGRTLELAAGRGAEAFLVAGDLFEDNQVDDALVGEVLELFGRHPGLPVFLLPGNHDPHTGPECVWERRLFRNAPDHVRVLKHAQNVELRPDVFLVASPLLQKRSTTDPSLVLAGLAAELRPDAIRIGLTHGAPAIVGKHQPNDFPIALDAASRAGLDYLGIGHWHNWLPDLDGGRMVMPGTPEPDQFGQERSGAVAWVELDGRGGAARVERLEVATLRWVVIDVDVSGMETAEGVRLPELDGLDPGGSVVRVNFRGTTSPRLLSEVRRSTEARLDRFVAWQIADVTRVELTLAERTDLERRHPMLARVLEDLDRMERLVTGVGAGVERGEDDAGLSLVQVQEMLEGAKIPVTELGTGQFTRMRQLLMQTVQEVAL